MEQKGLILIFEVNKSNGESSVYNIWLSPEDVNADEIIESFKMGMDMRGGKLNDGVIIESVALKGFKALSKKEFDSKLEGIKYA